MVLIPAQSDGLGGFLSALFTVTPLSIFAQVGFAAYAMKGYDR